MRNFYFTLFSITQKTHALLYFRSWTVLNCSEFHLRCLFLELISFTKPQKYVQNQIISLNSTVLSRHKLSEHNTSNASHRTLKEIHKFACVTFDFDNYICSASVNWIYRKKPLKWWIIVKIKRIESSEEKIHKKTDNHIKACLFLSNTL